MLPPRFVDSPLVVLANSPRCHHAGNTLLYTLEELVDGGLLVPGGIDQSQPVSRRIAQSARGPRESAPDLHRLFTGGCHRRSHVVLTSGAQADGQIVDAG